MKLTRNRIVGAAVAFAGVVGLGVYMAPDAEVKHNAAGTAATGFSGSNGNQDNNAQIFTGENKFADAAAFIAKNAGDRPYADPLKKKGVDEGRPYAEPLKKEMSEEIVEQMIDNVGITADADVNVFAGDTTSTMSQSFDGASIGGGYPVIIGGGGGGGGWYPVDPVPPVTPVDPTTPAVPEPSTWGMMILGMGMIGAAMRRRREGAEAAFSPTGP